MTFTGKFVCFSATVISSWVLFGAAVSPLQRLKKDLRNQYGSEFTVEVINGFADMEVTRRGATKNSLKWFGKDAIAYYRDFGDYAALASLGEEKSRTNLVRLATAFNDKWMTYWKGLDSEVRSRLLSNPDRLDRFLNSVESLKNCDEDGQRFDFLCRHPNSLVYLDEFPELLRYPEKDVASVVFALSRIKIAELKPNQKKELHAALCHVETVASLVRDKALRQIYGDAPILLYLAEPRLFQVSSCPEDDLVVNRNRVMLLATHLDYFAKRRALSSDWDREVADFNSIFSYIPKLRDLTEEDWLQMLLACRPESEKLFELLKRYLHTTTGFSTLERMVAAIIQDMHRYPPSDLCVLLRLIREGSMIEDFEALARICLDVGLKVNPKDECQYPGVMLVLSGVPADDPLFMDYLGKERFGVRLIAYLGDINYGNDIAERWGRAKQLKLKDAEYDESDAKQLINHIPCAGSLVNVGIKLSNGYPVSTAEYLCASVDAAGLVLDVVTFGAGAGATEAAKEGVKQGAKKVASEIVKKTLAEKAKDAAIIGAKKTAMWWAKTQVKKYATQAGQYLDENRDELKDQLQKIYECIQKFSDGENRLNEEQPPSVFAKDEITAQKLMVTFGRVMPLQNRLVGSYANSRGVSQIFEAPPSYEKWVRDFDSPTGDILLVSLCCL